MKAIGVKLVDLKPMTAKEAVNAGYRVSNNGEIVPPFTTGYEITYPDGYKSWCPKQVADASYFGIEKIDKITPADVANFIIDENYCTLGNKTTAATLHTITGFQAHGLASCIKPENYDINIGKEIAKEKAIDSIWQGLGFVLHWALNGLKRDK